MTLEHLPSSKNGRSLLGLFRKEKPINIASIQRSRAYRFSMSMPQTDTQVPSGYRPGVLVKVLGITRGQFRHWCSELDPKPTRSRLSYPMMLAYAVIVFLVKRLRYPVIDLKHFDMTSFFDWFEQSQKDVEIILDGVIEVDPMNLVITAKPHESGYQPPPGDTCIQVIYLREVDAWFSEAFRQAN